MSVAASICPPWLPLPLESLQLEQWSVSALQQCSSRRDQRSRRPHRNCTNLAPAGTGSTSLAFALARSGRKGRSFWHHNHDRRAASADFAQRHISCFIMTLRDPAARLASGFRVGPAAFGVPMREGQRLPQTLSEWLRAIRNASSAHFAHAMRAYTSSVSWPTTEVGARKHPLKNGKERKHPRC